MLVKIIENVLHVIAENVNDDMALQEFDFDNLSGRVIFHGTRSSGNFANSIHKSSAHVDMILHCPECGVRHIDEGEFETKVHYTHAC